MTKKNMKKIVTGVGFTLVFFGVPWGLGSWVFQGNDPILIKWILGCIVVCVLAVVWLLFYGGLQAVLEKIK